MELDNLIYRSKESPEFFLRYAGEQDDAQLIELISESMPSNGMTISFERKPSYFTATKAQYNKPEIMVVVHQDHPEKIIAMINIGWKNYWINGEKKEIRYVSDLRVKMTSRGKKAFSVFSAYVLETFSSEIIFQSIILEDNHLARNMMHSKRAGNAVPYIFDNITTYTISKTPNFRNLERYSLIQLKSEYYEKANQYIAEMSQHYNFLPDYDFKLLESDSHPFWCGLNNEDFYLVLDQQEKVVGLFGLWNQTGFRQTKVKQYSKLLKVLKPFYNLYAKVSGQLSLPAEGCSFEYLMTHSFLSNPNDLDVLRFMLTQANTLVKSRDKTSFCITVADNDPRKQILEQCTSHKMKAIHSLHSFGAQPFEEIGRGKLSYFDVSRI